MDAVITTPRLQLRHWRDADRPLFAELCADPEVMKFFPSTLDRQQSDASIDRFMQCIASNGWGFWAAELLPNKELSAPEGHNEHRFIGFIGINDNPFGLPFSPCIDIGWRLSKDFWGQGLATEGAKAVLEYVFLQVNLAEIVSMTPLLNASSERVMQKFGMNKKAQTFKHPKLSAGHPLEEHVLYSLTRGEYLKAIKRTQS